MSLIPAGHSTSATTGSIWGVIFYDSDNSGSARNVANEPGFAGWTLLLEDGVGAVLGKATTDSSGAFSFGGILPGTYKVFEVFPPNGYPACGASTYPTVVPPCWEETYPGISGKGGVGYTSITVTDGLVTSGIDFGNVFYSTTGSGGDSIGFWASKNGQSLLTVSDAIFLNGEAPFSKYTVYPLEPATTYACVAPIGPLHVTPFCQTSTSVFGAQLHDFLLVSNSIDARYMLAAKLAAFQLDLRHGIILSDDRFVVGTSAPGYPGLPSSCTGPMSTIVGGLVASCSILAWNLGSGTAGASASLKGVQTFWETLLDDIDSNSATGEGSVLAVSSPVVKPLDSSSLPLPPLAPGCYRYNPTVGVWQSIGCLSPQSVLNSGHLPQSVQGIQSGPPVGGGSATLLNGAQVQINFDGYGGSSDSISGPSAYSVQLNTNFFIGTSNNPNGDRDWVQFAYQDQVPNCGGDGCGSLDRFCVWNIDSTTKNYNPTACVSPGDVGLTNGYVAAIYGFAVNQKLVSEAFLPGQSPLSLVSPDTYGLANSWTQASGNVLGAGGGSVLQFAGFPSKEQTNVGVQSCSAAQAVTGGCSQISGSQFNGQTCFGAACYGTAESNDFAKHEVNPVLTSYLGGTHWWLSTVSCESGQSIVYQCDQWAGDGTILGSSAMDYTISVKPTSVSTEVGAEGDTSATLTSDNGLQTGDITISLDGAPPGSTYPSTSCSFGAPLQPGSSCGFLFRVQTTISDSPGTYTLTLHANAPGVCTCSVGASTTYSLTLFLNPPTPVIVKPGNGQTFGIGQGIPLVGYAQSTDPQFFGSLIPGFLPCSQLTFHWTAPDGTTGDAAPPVQDPVVPYECDASISFSGTGTGSVSLSATDTQGTGTTSPVFFDLAASVPFSFSINAPTSAPVFTNPVSGSKVTFTIQVVLNAGTSQPVTLSASGLPSDAIVGFSSSTVTPTSTVAVTVTDTDGANIISTLVITGTAGSVTESASVIVLFEQVH